MVQQNCRTKQLTPKHIRIKVSKRTTTAATKHRINHYLLKPTNCTYLSNHLKPHYWIKMDLKYLLHVSIPLWDHPQGA